MFQNLLYIEDIFNSKTVPKRTNVDVSPKKLQHFFRKWGGGGFKSRVELENSSILVRGGFPKCDPVFCTGSSRVAFESAQQGSNGQLRALVLLIGFNGDFPGRCISHLGSTSKEIYSCSDSTDRILLLPKHILCLLLPKYTTRQSREQLTQLGIIQK